MILPANRACFDWEHNEVYYHHYSHTGADMVLKAPSISLTPSAVALELARRFRARRLGRGLTQLAVAQAAGMSRDTVKSFESTGRITLHHLLRLAGALGALPEFAALLPAEQPQTLADLEARAAGRGRVRGRRRDAHATPGPPVPGTRAVAPPIVTVRPATEAANSTTRKNQPHGKSGGDSNATP